jgi:hypothetical protein
MSMMFKLASQSVASPIGQEYFVTSTNWTCPVGVTSVCVVAIGGGGGGISYTSGTFAMSGGGGGGLGWKNNITVIPGNTYTIGVGNGGSQQNYPTNGNDGGVSYFKDLFTVAGYGGQGGAYDTSRIGGSWVGDGGGMGGGVFVLNSSYLGPQGGGGGGGYTGTGGFGGYSSTRLPTSGSGGAGGGGGNNGTNKGYGGGGTGIYGQGSNGTSSGTTPGGGGSSGTNGSTNGLGGAYGGGGGGSNSGTGTAGNGFQGIVRIIWGDGRAFPSTNTQNM